MIAKSVLTLIAATTAFVAAGLVYARWTARQAPFEIGNGAPDVERGRYLALAAGCASCHASDADGLRFGGGIALQSPFGVIYSKNISPDPAHGIGAWTDEQFLNAVKRGVSPRGAHYYPAFPYARYAGLTTADALDILAFLRSLPPVADAPRKTALPFPFNMRAGIAAWKLLYAHEPERRDATVGRSPFERGRYLVEHAAHCGECHTPRTFAFGLDPSRPFEGARGFDGAVAPPLTPVRLRKAGFEAFEATMKFGLTLDGSASIEARTMQDVARNISELTDSDRRAIFEYLSTRDHRGP